jgi:two-component system, OmpR family, sensor histidine kinase QseC
MPDVRTRRSMRRKLLLILLGSVAVVWIGTAAVSYVDARHELDELLDAHLAQSASLLIAQAGHDVEEIEEHAPDMQRYARRVAFQFWEGGTQLRLHSSNAPGARLSQRDEGFSDVRIDGQRWRVFSGWDRKHRYVVQVGERLGTRDEIVATMARNLLVPLVVALPVLALLIAFTIGRVLRPLQLLNRQVEHRAPDNLALLDVQDAPAEVAPLVVNLNRLFERVQASIENERRFTADAAHELRTPLAAIRAQAQVARGATRDPEREHALDNVIAGCDRAAHLVQQLLTLARLEPAHFNTARAPCDLRTVAEEAIADTMSFALARRVEIDLGEGASGVVQADPRLLGILLRNLLDNAVRYSPSDSTVHVRLGARNLIPYVTVADEGPGVPRDERERLGQRFHRLAGGEIAGTGLGLSIVRRIAQLHGALLTFGEAPGGGLAVSVEFPPD